MDSVPRDVTLPSLDSLHAPVREVLVVLELVGVVLQQRSSVAGCFSTSSGAPYTVSRPARVQLKQQS